jgi:hypothetical protein
MIPLVEKVIEYKELALLYGGNNQKGSKMFLVEEIFYVFNARIIYENSFKSISEHLVDVHKIGYPGLLGYCGIYLFELLQGMPLVKLNYCTRRMIRQKF